MMDYVKHFKKIELEIFQKLIDNGEQTGKNLSEKD